jgi:hypothetical protein
MILKTKKRKYNLQGGDNTNNGNGNGNANISRTNKIKQKFKSGYKTMKSGVNKIKKSSLINTKTAANKCNFSSILLGTFKCESETGLFKNECDKKYILKRIKHHLMFKNEPDKIYIKKYFETTLNKYINKSKNEAKIKKKLSDVASLLECMNYDMSNIFMVFYKINTFEFDPESDNYNDWVETKSLNQNNRNKTDKKILLEKIADFIVNVLVKSFIDYNNKNLKIESDFKSFLTSFDSNLKYSYDSLIKNKNNKKELESKLNIFKSDLISIFMNDYINKKLDKFYKEYQEKKESHTEQIVSTMFDKNKSSKFLTIISGMLLFALLMKFDVFTAAPGVGSGTF